MDDASNLLVDVDRIPQLVWVADPHGRLLFVNSECRRFFGCENAAEGWAAFMHDDDRVAVGEAWRAATQNGEPFVVEARFKRADGEYRWLSHRAVAIFEDGHIVRWLGASVDVHEQKELVARLRLSETQAYSLGEAIPQLVWISAADGRLEWFNRHWTEYTGLDLAETLSRQATDWGGTIYPDDTEIVVSRWYEALEAGRSYEAEARLRRFDGAYRWFLARGVPLRDAGGAIVKWFGTCTDIDERVRSEERMRAVYERERRVAETFQQAALPQRLPVVPGIVFDSFYHPARDDALVGGDWYDAVKLADRRIVISIGDVSGSGLDAAVTMSAIRQIIRGIAQVHADPNSILDAADRTLKAEYPDRVVTALVAVIDPIARTLTYASAGHPSPLLRYESGLVRELEVHDLPLGLRVKSDVSSTVIDLPERALLVFYTDGLTESTRDVLEGERRLHEVVRGDDILHQPHSARAIYDAMLDRGAHDDVVILTVQVDLSHGVRCFEEMIRRWGFGSSDAASATAVRRDIASALRERDATEPAIVTAELILSELIANVVRHAPGTVEVVLDLSDQAAVMHVLDGGPGFTLTPRLPTDLLAERGRGLYLVWSLAEDFNVTRRPDGGAHARVVLPTLTESESQVPPRILSQTFSLR